MSNEVCLRGARVFDGEKIVDGVSIRIADGIIVGVDSKATSNATDLDGGILVPGFVDLQVNGGGGVLFNNDPTVAALKTIAEAHRRGGTTSILPTLITDTRDNQQAGITAVEKAIEDEVPGILGIHLEGPHLDRTRRGVHREELVRPIDDEDVARLGALAGEMRVLLTLAPEHVDPGVIRKLSDSGVIVCAGHTDAGYEIIRRAVDHGLRGFTHLYNAMSQLSGREPGAVGAGLDLDDCACGIIADGQHVSAAALRIAHRAKPEGKLFFVSDAMATAGTDASEYELYGEVVKVIDGCLRNSEGRIAGSNIRLNDAVRIAHRDVGLTLEESLRMASLYPATFVGRDDTLGRIRNGYRADLVHLDDELNVLGAWVSGARFDTGGQ